MAATASPYGLRPVQLVGGLPYAGAIRSYALANNSASAFYFGSIVGLNASGDPAAIAASPLAGTVDGNSPIGIFMGCEYEDNVKGFVNAQFFPANGITGGAKKVRFKILDAPNIVMQVQSIGTIAAGNIGKNIAMSTFAVGSAATGNSTAACTATAAATATLGLKIIGYVEKAGVSTAGDAFTDLFVIWNAGTHRYAQGAGL